MNLIKYIIFGLLLVPVMGVAQNSSDIVKVGDEMPEFKVKVPSGDISSGDLKGKVVLINFFATWCPPCRKELPYLEKQVWNKYKENPDFALLVIGREHSEEEVKKFADAKYSMPFYPDEGRKIFSKFAIKSIPRNYIINKKGEVIYASVGFSDYSFNKMLEVLKQEMGE